MSFIQLDNEESILEVHVGEDIFHISKGGDGGLYIETPDRGHILVSVNDEDDASVEADGLWATVTIVPCVQRKCD
jgi:hypothetical protein